MYQSEQMLAVKKLLDKLIKPKHPNIIRFDVRTYDTDKLGSIPQVYVHIKETDDDDENNTNWILALSEQSGLGDIVVVEITESLLLDDFPELSK